MFVSKFTLFIFPLLFMIVLPQVALSVKPWSSNSKRLSSLRRRRPDSSESTQAAANIFRELKVAIINHHENHVVERSPQRSSGDEDYDLCLGNASICPPSLINGIANCYEKNDSVNETKAIAEIETCVCNLNPSTLAAWEGCAGCLTKKYNDDTLEGAKPKCLTSNGVGSSTMMTSPYIWAIQCMGTVAGIYYVMA